MTDPLDRWLAARAPDAPVDVSRHAADPFPEWRPGERYGDAVESGSLLDHEPVRRALEQVDAGRAANVYCFSLPLDRAAGADSGFAGGEMLSMSTYHYLGLNGHPRIVAAAEAALRRYGTSAGGARLLTGTLDLHVECETALAEHLGVESAALLSSGYDANLAALSALLGPGDVAVLDEHVHRSVADGCRLASATVVRFRHGDLAHCESVLRDLPGTARRLVVVDGVYSMDGDIADLPAVLEVTRRAGAALMLDDAHAIGVLGRHGRGTAEALGVDPGELAVITGSLGKAIPSAGGFVAGSRALLAYLRHHASPMLFSAALNPANTAAVLEALSVIRDEPHHAQAMWRNTHALVALVRELGLDPGRSATPIVPVILGDDLRAFLWSRMLLEQGVQASAVAYPGVARGAARLRLCATGAHTPDHYARLRAGLRTAARWEAELLSGG